MSEKLCTLRKIGGGNIDGSNTVRGSITTSTTQDITVNLGFKPRIVVVYGKCGPSSYDYIVNIAITNTDYNASIGSQQPVPVWNVDTLPVSTTLNNRIRSINSNGFTMGKTGVSATCIYLALK